MGGWCRWAAEWRSAAQAASRAGMRARPCPPHRTAPAPPPPLHQMPSTAPQMRWIESLRWPTRQEPPRWRTEQWSPGRGAGWVGGSVGWAGERGRGCKRGADMPDPTQAPSPLPPTHPPTRGGRAPLPPLPGPHPLSQLLPCTRPPPSPTVEATVLRPVEPEAPQLLRLAHRQAAVAFLFHFHQGHGLSGACERTGGQQACAGQTAWDDAWACMRRAAPRGRQCGWRFPLQAGPTRPEPCGGGTHRCWGAAHGSARCGCWRPT